MVDLVTTVVITLTFIEVVSNKRLNGASVTAVWEVIHSFASKKVEGRKNSLSTRHSARLCVKPAEYGSCCDKSGDLSSSAFDTHQEATRVYRMLHNLPSECRIALKLCKTMWEGYVFVLMC